MKVTIKTVRLEAESAKATAIWDDIATAFTAFATDGRRKRGE